MREFPGLSLHNIGKDVLINRNIVFQETHGQSNTSEMIFSALCLDF